MTMEQLELHDIQRLIIQGYADLSDAAYVLLRIENVERTKRWLAQLLPRVGNAMSGTQHASRSRVALAFTYRGLVELGLDPSALEQFVPEFRQGMTAPARARALGDQGANHSEHWRWGGPSSEVHMLCALFGRGNMRQAEQLLCDEAQGTHGVDTIFAQLRDREPFGFRDNLSQPLIAGTRRAQAAPSQAVAAGEFLLGYRNEMGQYPASPLIDAQLDPDDLLAPHRDGKLKDFGRNGSYMVLRELEQNVEAFNKLAPETACRMIGREKDGTPLVAREHRDPSLDFGYFYEDPAGLRCPLGAHIRRANPRDALADVQRDVSPQAARKAANQHRILRRSRMLNDESRKQGLCFICFNANLERQFEFVQQAWLMSPKFAGLQDEVDPLLGRKSEGQMKFTVDWKLGRVEEQGHTDYVTPRGGAYFFAPSLKGLSYLTRTLRSQ